MKLHGERLLSVMIPKHALTVGEYYVGLCRNATVARWDGERFHHWRRKFGHEFVETIHHPEDDQDFDVFVPVARADPGEVRMIDITQTPL